jgi:pantoate--beta-alanine ligase
MKLVRTRSDLADATGAAGSGSIALVPTMGALHEGHLSLFDIARDRADRVACSLFVNPLQFGPDEDLDRYPRDLEGDLAALEKRGVDLVFAPSTEEMYPEGRPRIAVDPGTLGDRLCGLSRPGHFRGVLTVVARLFGLMRPQVAVFGRKDFQQSVLISRMVADLALGVEIVVAPIVREVDGLAMSSRNALLPSEARVQAVGLSEGLMAGGRAFAAGERDPGRIESAALEVTSARYGIQIEYISLVSPGDLEPPDRASAEDVLAIAGHCGGVRLIDNVTLGAAQ